MKLAVLAFLAPVFSVLAVNTPLEPRTIVVEPQIDAQVYYRVSEPISEGRRGQDAKVGTFSKVPQPKFALNK